MKKLTLLAVCLIAASAAASLAAVGDFESSLLTVAAVVGAPAGNAAGAQSMDAAGLVALIKRIKNGETVDKSDVAAAKAWVAAKRAELNDPKKLAEVRTKAKQAAMAENAKRPKDQQLTEAQIDALISYELQQRLAYVNSSLDRVQAILDSAKTK